MFIKNLTVTRKAGGLNPRGAMDFSPLYFYSYEN
jgi:hypothetical protein